MRKSVVVVFLSAFLVMLPVAASLVSPPAAAADQQLKRAGVGTDPGLVLLDLIVVRPIPVTILAGAVITYPVAYVLDPLFRNDRKKLEREWVTRHYDFAIRRPLGNFGGDFK